MRFDKGNTKGKGRPKGSKNKSTDNIKKAFHQLITDNLEVLQEDLDDLTPKDRLKTITDLAKYVIPIQKQIDADVRNENTNLDWLLDISEDEILKKIEDNE